MAAASFSNKGKKLGITVKKRTSIGNSVRSRRRDKRRKQHKRYVGQGKRQ